MVLSPKSYVDVPAGPRKSDYLYTNFLPNFPPISIPFSKEKHPIWIKLGAFYNNLPKIHPIYVIWAPSSLMKTPRSLYQISRKRCPKRQAHIRIPYQCETPPGGKVTQWGEDFFFFFFFSLFKTSEICFGSTRMETFYRDKAFHARGKNQEKWLCPLWKIFLLRPWHRPLSALSRPN